MRILGCKRDVPFCEEQSLKRHADIEEDCHLRVCQRCVRIGAVGFATCRRQQGMQGSGSYQGAGGLNFGVYARGKVPAVGDRPSKGGFR